MKSGHLGDASNKPKVKLEKFYPNGGGGDDRGGGGGGEGGSSVALWRLAGGDQSQEEGLTRVTAQVTAATIQDHDHDQLTL